MPVHDIDVSRAWIAANIRPRARRKSSSALVEPTPPKPAPDPLPQQPDTCPAATADLDISWPAKIARAHRVEVLLFQAIDRALAGREVVQLGALLSAYTRSFAGIADAESTALDIQTKRRELIPMDDAKAALAEVLTPIRQALESLPMTERSRCNPTDPNVAGAALQEWVTALMKRISGMESTLSHDATS